MTSIYKAHIQISCLHWITLITQTHHLFIFMFTNVVGTIKLISNGK